MTLPPPLPPRPVRPTAGDRSRHRKTAGRSPTGRPQRRGLPGIGDPVDLNRATVHDLTRLPGVGPVLAARILEARQSAGRFDTVETVRDVRGLGGIRLERLRPLITVGAP